MGVRKGLAQAVSAVSTIALKKVFHRPAANFPGKVALYVDPHIIGDMAGKLRRGSIIVAGTNGKTTVSNLLADALEQAGQSVVCNRTGANLDSGVATSLLHADESDWGVFESDELWMVKILPFLKSDYVLLLNLFRDQLDRVGEIDKVQESIVCALESSPETVLIYNADDPLCTAIADTAANKSIAFGIDEDMHLAQNTVADAQMCQKCSGMLDYAYRQYGQLGDFHCDSCDFGRHELDYAAADVRLADAGLGFSIKSGVATGTLSASYSGAYMVYNLLAVYVASVQMGVPASCVQAAIDRFDPENGRLQHMTIAGREVLLNLAKNPTGFNQNMKLVVQGRGRKVAAFFLNDKEADGHDISWIWDVDFEELAQSDDLIVYAGGIRKNDLQLRLKYAGIDAKLVDTADEVMDEVNDLPSDYRVFMIANYTALPAVRSALMQRRDNRHVSIGDEKKKPPLSDDAKERKTSSASVSPAVQAKEEAPYSATPLRIVHLFPELLNLYGDGGNPKVLEARCRWRGLPARVVAVHHGEDVDLSAADIVVLGGGPDREQRLASAQLLGMRDQIRAYVEDDGVLLAICGGFQILGREWLTADESLEGLGIVDLTTRRAPGKERIIDNVVLDSSLASAPVVGYENHAGRTFIGEGLRPFGTVGNAAGVGNNDDDGVDGVLYKNVVGTYLHGPLLGKNPDVADWLIARALERRTGETTVLAPLDDTVEHEANRFMCKRLGARR